MIKLIQNLPANVLGIETEGEISKEDYDRVVVPKMNELANLKGEINYLVVLKTSVAEFSAGVWWDDFKLAIRHFSKWNKIAIVTDHDSIKKITDLFGFAFPGDPKGFKLSDYDEAVKWVS